MARPPALPCGGRVLAVVVAAVLGLAGCGGDGSGNETPAGGAGRRSDPTPAAGAGPACGPVTEEPLDAGSTQHLLPGAPEPSYAGDPPTSGAHLAGGAVRGVQAGPLARPVQVAVLEAGGVVVQHRGVSDGERRRLESLAGGSGSDGVVVQHRGVSDDERRRLESLAGGRGNDYVVVAPNPGLPAAVVATAWRHRLVCERAGSQEVAAVARFIADHRGKGPG